MSIYFYSQGVESVKIYLTAIIAGFLLLPASAWSQELRPLPNENRVLREEAKPEVPAVPKAVTSEPAPPAIEVHEPSIQFARAPTQAQFESASRTRIEELSKKLRDLRKELKLLPIKKQTRVEDLLRTSAGNRAVAIFKLKQLASAKEELWEVLKVEVEKAEEELAGSLERSRLELEKMKN